MMTWFNRVMEYLRDITGGQFGNWKDIFDGANGFDVNNLPAN